jgi:hypothetical protein
MACFKETKSLHLQFYLRAETVTAKQTILNVFGRCVDVEWPYKRARRYSTAYAVSDAKVEVILGIISAIGKLNKLHASFLAVSLDGIHKCSLLEMNIYVIDEHKPLNGEVTVIKIQLDDIAVSGAS